MRLREVAVMLLAGIVTGLCVLFVRVVIITGSSMEPTLLPGDICVALKGSSAQAGDVILFQERGSKAVVHRVIGMEEGPRFRTKGDANEVEDRDPLAPEAVVGRVVWVLPLGSAGQGWIRATMGATLLNQPE